MRMPWPYNLQCFDCATRYPNDFEGYHCEKCGNLLEVRFDLSKRTVPWKTRNFSVWKYRELLPVDDDRFITTLAEGGTGLHHCNRLGRDLGMKNLYVKNEGENPTGSFKDRGMTVALSKARELRKKRVACASTGNTSASLAAYSARAGLECIVFIPKGKIAAGKMLQVQIHGAKIVEVDGDFDKSMKMVVTLTDRRKGFYLMNSVNPYRLEGQKTLAFEVCDQLKGSPDTIVLPVGNGGNISAIWKGFKEFQKLGIANATPRMIGIQAKKAAPIAIAVQRQRNSIMPVKNPQTIATAIRIGYPVNWTKVLRSIKESNGTALTVSDNEILAAQRELASREGIFVEPASAASIAGLKKSIDNGQVDKSDRIVCVTTGHGLKDQSVSGRIPHPQSYNLKISDSNWIDRLERHL